MSHAIFGVTPGVCFPVVPLSPCLVNADGTSDNRAEINLYTATSNGNSNPGLPNGIVGGKFALSGNSATVQFYSPNVPVWGDFYAKGGKYANGGEDEEDVWNAVWNDGIGYISTTTDGFGNTSNNHFSDSTVSFIPRPDGSGLPPQGEIPGVPEPASLAMVGGGLLALAYGLRKIRRPSGASAITSRR
ncbi:MAG: PEP-CTERM sorting domain-containing protein [Bryobacterales bacterium]|nr:PEP-CTERM sorting domain-containing protein [Bryobacterales bacterium]